MNVQDSWIGFLLEIQRNSLLWGWIFKKYLGIYNRFYTVVYGFDSMKIHYNGNVILTDVVLSAKSIEH